MSADRFVTTAAERGVAVTVRRFPEGTRTAEDAARAIGCDVAQICKSLVFVADGEPVVVLTSGANRVDTGRLASLLDVSEVRKAAAAEVRDATGYAVGGTPPFGHVRPLKVVLDRDLLAHEEVWSAAGTPETVFPLSPAELTRAAGAVVADVAERASDR